MTASSIPFRYKSDVFSSMPLPRDTVGQMLKEPISSVTVSLATAEDSMFDEQRTTYRDFLQDFSEEAKLDHITARKWVRQGFA